MRAASSLAMAAWERSWSSRTFSTAMAVSVKDSTWQCSRFARKRVHWASAGAWE